MQLIQYTYIFPDGSAAIFMNDDRKNHFYIPPGDTFWSNFNATKQVMKRLKISYSEWKKRYCA